MIGIFKKVISLLSNEDKSVMVKEKSFIDTYKAQDISTVKLNVKKSTCNIISTKDIANHFNTNSININKAFNILLYAEKNGTWWVATVEGIAKGAVQKYNTKSKQKYIVWEDSILTDTELIKTINDICSINNTTIKKTSFKEKQLKGALYEEHVAKVYRSRGYHVSEYGKQQGKKDHGIDLIAKNKKHLVLIQCKNWNEEGKWKITHKDIKVFQTEARLFVENQPLLLGCQLTAMYSLSGDFIHVSAIKHLEEIQKIGKRVHYEIIRMD